MPSSARFLSPSEAARRLGVSVKALRLYEQRGLVAPARTATGWRVYGPQAMARAAEVAALRALGLGLARIARMLDGDDRQPALAAHQAALEDQARRLAETVGEVRALRRQAAPDENPAVAFDLPWPWGGERFELRDLRALTFLTGPLGSGKTRLALRLAQSLPGATFLGLDRSPAAPIDPAHAARIEQALAQLVEDGAVASDALRTLLHALEADGSGALVIDMPEQGLDQAGQQALVARLRRRGPEARPVVLLTRSSAILDLAAVGPDEAILYCPANHAPPIPVTPCPGSPGFEAVAGCVASPAVRARTAGMMAVMA